MIYGLISPGAPPKDWVFLFLLSKLLFMRKSSCDECVWSRNFVISILSTVDKLAGSAAKDS